MAASKSSFGKIKKWIDNLDKSSDSTGAPDWVKYVAMLTGVLAAVAGFLAVKSTNLTNDAIYESNQAILAQTQASDAWAEYQADSIKAHVIETQMLSAGPLDDRDRATLMASDKEYRDRQPASRQAALDKTKERDTHLDKGLQHLHEKDLLGYSSLLTQLGIALASVAAMTRMRTAFVAGALAGIAGIAITAYAFLSYINL